MMPTLTILLPLDRLEQLRAALTANQDDPLTRANVMAPGALAQVGDEPLRQLAEARIPLLSAACLLECFGRGVRVNTADS